MSKKLFVFCALFYSFTTQAAYVVMKDGNIAHKEEDKAAVIEIYENIISPLYPHVLPATLALENTPFNKAHLLSLLDNPPKGSTSLVADFMNYELETKYSYHTAYSVKYIPTAEYEVTALYAHIKSMENFFSCIKAKNDLSVAITAPTELKSKRIMTQSEKEAYDQVSTLGMRLLAEDQKIEKKISQVVRNENTAEALITSYLAANDALGDYHWEVQKMLGSLPSEAFATGENYVQTIWNSESFLDQVAFGIAGLSRSMLDSIKKRLRNLIPDKTDYSALIDSMGTLESSAEKSGGIILYRGTKGTPDQQLDSAKKNDKSIHSLSYSNTPFMCSMLDSGPSSCGARALDYMLHPRSIPYALSIPLKEFLSPNSLISETLFCAPLTPLAGLFFSGEFHSRTKVARDVEYSGIFSFGKHFPSVMYTSGVFTDATKTDSGKSGAPVELTRLDANPIDKKTINSTKIAQFQRNVASMIVQYATPLTEDQKKFDTYIQNQKTWLEEQERISLAAPEALSGKEEQENVSLAAAPEALSGKEEQENVSLAAAPEALSSSDSENAAPLNLSNVANSDTLTSSLHKKVSEQ